MLNIITRHMSHSFWMIGRGEAQFSQVFKEKVIYEVIKYQIDFPQRRLKSVKNSVKTEFKQFTTKQNLVNCYKE